MGAIVKPCTEGFEETGLKVVGATVFKDGVAVGLLVTGRALGAALVGNAEGLLVVGDKDGKMVA